MADRVTVFLLDDHEIVRRGVRDLSEAEDDLVVVGEASTEDEAVRRIPGARPGRRRARRAHARRRRHHGLSRDPFPAPAHGVPHVDAFADDEALVHAIMAGAAGYVLKQIRSSDLLDAVRRVAAGQQLLDPAVTAQLMERLRRGRSRTS